MAAKKPGKGTKARSAITGRYVKKKTAKRHPRTTVLENVLSNSKAKAKPGKGGAGTKGTKK